MFAKKAFRKNMAILVCVALVSLFLPAISSPYERKIPSDSKSYTYTIAKHFLYAKLSIDLLLNGLISSDQSQNDQSYPRNVQGNSISKKKPTNSDD